jgi:hypothetical protein
LGRVDHRTVNAYGVEFEHIRYNSRELAALRHQLKGQPAKIKYHPGDLSRLYVFDPFENQYLEAPACDPEGYTQNLSLWKHNVIRAYLLSQSEKPNLAALGRAKREIRDIVAEAKRQKKQRTRSKIARWESTPPSGVGKKSLPAPTPPEVGSSAEELGSSPAKVKLDLPPASDSAPVEGWAITYDRPGTARDARTPRAQVRS